MDERQFENYLRQFRPVAPPGLYAPAPSDRFVNARWLRAVLALATLAVVLLVFTKFNERTSKRTAVLLNRPPAVASEPLTLGRVNALTRGNSERLDELMATASPETLPQMHTGGVLQALAKE